VFACVCGGGGAVEGEERGAERRERASGRERERYTHMQGRDLDGISLGAQLDVVRG
jgi:hypothetical protein